MSKIQKYKPTDKMSNVIRSNYSLISVMVRFGIPFGFGERTVAEVCRQHGVDCNTFLVVVNFMDDEQQSSNEVDALNENLSLSSLLEYLKQAHSYFLDFCLPSIRSKLIEALKLDTNNADVVQSIIMSFDEYGAEVRRHMEYENKYVFKYVNQLLSGVDISTLTYRIKSFAQKHNHIEKNLTELKNIIIKYYPQEECNNLLNSTLFDIFNCEHELNLHCKLEDNIFTPAVANLERRLVDEK